MTFSYSTGNLIFFGFLIILLILPIFDRHKIGKFQTQKSLLGIRLWAITYLPMEREVTNVMTRGNLGAFMDNDSFQLIWDISCCGSFVWEVMVFREKKLSPCNLLSCQAFYHHFEILQSECTITEGIGMWATSSMYQYFSSNWWDNNGTEIIQHLPEDKQIITM